MKEELERGNQNRSAQLSSAPNRAEGQKTGRPDGIVRRKKASGPVP